MLYTLDDDEAALSRVKRLKLSGPRSLLPDKRLSLPVSPIGKPSTLEFQEATSDSDFSSVFAVRHIPRVSTQKLPHHTALNSFHLQPPPPPQKKTGLPKTRESLGPTARERASLWTESVFPTRRGDSERIGNLSAESSFMNESLGPLKRSSGKEYGWKKTEWPLGKPLRERDVHREQGQLSRLEFLDRKTKRKPLVAEKSFDHEVLQSNASIILIYFVLCQTPFNFGPHPFEMEQESHGKELPKTKAALLDFHASENPTKQRMQVLSNVCFSRCFFTCV